MVATGPNPIGVDKIEAPGCRETVIDGQTGFLVPVGDGNAVAQRMLEFIENPELVAEMGKTL